MNYKMIGLSLTGGTRNGKASDKPDHVAIKALLLIPIIAIGLMANAQTEELDSLCSVPVMEIKTESLCRIIDTLKTIEREEGFDDSDWVYITFVIDDAGTICVMYMRHDDNFGKEITSWALGHAWVAYYKETKIMIVGKTPHKKIMEPSEDRYYLRCIIFHPSWGIDDDDGCCDGCDDDDDTGTMISAEYSNGKMHIVAITRRSGETTIYDNDSK